MASLAYLLGGVGQAGGGYFSGWLVRRGHSVDSARKFACTLGGVIATAGTFLVPIAGSVRLAGILAGLGILGANMMSNMQIAVITDVFPPSVQARVTSLTGFGEGLVNMGMSLSTGFLVDHFSFAPVFMSAAILPVVALAALFFLVRNCRRLSRFEIVPAVS
jgi:ACS family hexuronate transporter-like MFS transporter